MELKDWLIVLIIVFWVGLSIRRILKHKGGCSCSGSSCLGSCSSCTAKCDHKNK